MTTTTSSSASAPLLRVEGLRKQYRRGFLRPQTTFSLEADFEVEGPGIIGVMGANGAGKTTLFELITGGNLPTGGRVMVAGQDIHRVRYRERCRLAMHYHQSYQVRSFQRGTPEFLLERAGRDTPCVHLFDEPQFNPQDGYIGFMLDFFRRLKAEGKLVFVCLHPNEPYHLELLREVCERFVFVKAGRLRQGSSLAELAAHEDFRAYLGSLAPLVDAAAASTIPTPTV